MKRLVLSTFALFSMILFGATLIVWLRSYWREDIATAAGLPAWSGYSTMGAVTIDYTDAGGYSSKAYWVTQITSPTWAATRERSFLFHYGTHTETGTFQSGMLPPVLVVMRHYKSLTIPYWAPALLFTALAWLFLHLATWRRRTKPGHCPTCHYDLRAHAPRQKCPECGTPIEVPATKQG